MNRKMLFGFVAVLMLASMVGLSSASSANSLGVSSTGASFVWNFTGEGQVKSSGGTDLASYADRVMVTLTLTTRLKITVVIADCCLMGDTIAAFYPTTVTQVFSATSPRIIIGSATLSAGTYTFWVGYTSCPGGFPAGLYLWVISTHA